MIKTEMKAQFNREMNVYRSEPFFLELNPLNIDKAQSLQILLDHTGYTREEMLACGDGFNDLTMIEFAGFGVAMAMRRTRLKKYLIL